MARNRTYAALVIGFMLLVQHISPVYSRQEALIISPVQTVTVVSGAYGATPTALSVTPVVATLQASEEVQPVTSNALWGIVIARFDSVDMVLVPPGCFMMGDNDPDFSAFPLHRVCIESPFWLDRYEVTRGQVAKRYGWRFFNYWPLPEQPRSNVTWFEARDWCAERGARLPTEAEWEYAARGPDGLLYPWGNDADVYDNRWWELERNKPGAYTVGSWDNDVSWVGAYDMAANVSEWVNSIARPYPYNANDGRERTDNTRVQRIIRGGDYSLGGLNSSRWEVDPDISWEMTGFRCAHSY